jgi:hypothetical protein
MGWVFTKLPQNLDGFTSLAPMMKQIQYNTVSADIFVLYFFSDTSENLYWMTSRQHLRALQF